MHSFINCLIPFCLRWLRLLVSIVGGLFVLLLVAAHILEAHFRHSLPPPEMGLPEHVGLANGQQIELFRHSPFGESPTILFVHGTPGEAGVFRRQFSDPTLQSFDLLSYDRPGFGHSLGTNASARLFPQVESLIGLIRLLHLNHVVLVGHSYGAPIALAAVLREPKLFSGLVLIGGCVDPAQEKPWPIQYLFANELTRWLLPESLRYSNLELLRLKADLVDLTLLLPQLETPIRMLQGNQDQQVPMQNVVYFEKALKKLGKERLLNSTLFPGYNHFFLWEHPEVVNPLLFDFVKKVNSDSHNGF